MVMDIRGEHFDKMTLTTLVGYKVSKAVGNTLKRPNMSKVMTIMVMYVLLPMAVFPSRLIT